MRFTVLFLLVLTIGCTSTEKETVAEDTDSVAQESSIDPQELDNDSVNVDSPDAIPQVRQPLASLEAQTFIVGLDTAHIITLRTETLIEVIDTVSSFDQIDKEDYAQYDIPAAALNAGGAWHEEAGEYFYVIEEGQDLVVYRAWLKEEQTTNTYPYKELSRFSLPDIEF